MHLTRRRASVVALQSCISTLICSLSGVWTICQRIFRKDYSGRTIAPFHTLPTPHRTPTATFQNSSLRSCPRPVCVPTKPSADHIPFHILTPLLISEETLGIGEVVRDRKTLFKHSRALICTALSADVVGGCIDGAASGGNERAVG